MSRKLLDNYEYFMLSNDHGLAVGYHNGYDRLFAVSVGENGDLVYEVISTCATDNSRLRLVELLKEVFDERILH